MKKSFQQQVIESLQRELPNLGNKRDAFGMQAYMKDISPFLGVRTPARRSLGRTIFKTLESPSSDQLGKTARALWALPYREYQYLACDMIAYFVDVADKNFLADHVQFLLTKKSWWDTVDSLGSAAVSPLTMKYPSASLMNKWNKSSDLWLNRAAIQHQRGRKGNTDIPLLLRFCDDHSDSHEFFIAKAIGWALRDLAHLDRSTVNKFLATHPDLDRVAVREARKHE